jgi:3'(2'), 5'-bisphosphate nucleotidase
LAAKEIRMRISKELELAITAALKAGEAIMEIYEGEDFEVEFKGDNSPLTKADKVADEIIKSYLKASDLPILSEEGAKVSYAERKNWKLFWMVDPIDGTKEFIERNGEFTVNIALIENQIPILGVVYAPAIKNLYFAKKGVGSFKTENIISFEDLNELDFIDLSKSTYPEIYTLVVSKSHMNEQTQQFVDQKEKEFGDIAKASFGSSLKLCKVAEGSAHCYPRFGPTMEWDTAAAHAVALISDCLVTKTDLNSTLIYNKKNLLNPYFIVQ